MDALAQAVALFPQLVAVRLKRIDAIILFRDTILGFPQPSLCLNLCSIDCFHRSTGILLRVFDRKFIPLITILSHRFKLFPEVLDFVPRIPCRSMVTLLLTRALHALLEVLHSRVETFETLLVPFSFYILDIDDIIFICNEASTEAPAERLDKSVLVSITLLVDPIFLKKSVPNARIAIL